jgi:hypothetical protein
MLMNVVLDAAATKQDCSALQKTSAVEDNCLVDRLLE